MEINLNSHYIHEILSLSKADNISFISRDGATYIVVHEQRDVTFKNQVIRKLCGVGNSGQTLISRNVLKLLPKDTPVTITEDIIIAGKRKIKYAPNSLVDKPKVIDNLLTTIKYKELEHLLSGYYAIATDVSRPVLNGICIDNGEFTACDGYRITIRKGNFEVEEQVIIDLNMVNTLKKIKSEVDVKIYFDNLHVKFQFGDLEVIGYRIQGDYLKYKTMIPNEYRTKVDLETRPTLDILKDYKKNKFKLVKLNFTKNELIISSSNENATVEESLNINLQGEPLEIAFNVDYLIDCFKNYETATLELSSGIGPMIIKTDNKLDLVLPVRLKK